MSAKTYQTLQIDALELKNLLDTTQSSVFHIKGKLTEKHITVLSKFLTDPVTADRITSLNLSDTTIAALSANAFRGCEKLQSIKLPNCTKIINSHAFEGCTALTSISGQGVEVIGPKAFSGCINLSAMSFPTCAGIDDNAFEGCTSLNFLSLPKAYAFTSLTFKNTTFKELHLTCHDSEPLLCLSDTMFTGITEKIKKLYLSKNQKANITNDLWTVKTVAGFNTCNLNNICEELHLVDKEGKQTLFWLSDS